MKWAEEKSVEEIDNTPLSRKTRRNTLRKIHVVCKALVDRKKPIRPTAEEVSESGNTPKFGFDGFPSSRTIYNDYSKMLGHWRKAYDDIINLEAEPVSSDAELLNWDANHLDDGSQQMVKALKRLVQELLLKINALRQLVTDNLSVDLDGSAEHAGAIIDNLELWFSEVLLDGFELNEFGLLVTSRSGPGTMIMDHGLWAGLQTLVEMYRSNERARIALDGNRASSDDH